MKISRPVTALFSSIILITVFSSAYAEKTLSKSEAKALFIDVTYDGHNLKTNLYYHAYNSPDGKHTMIFANGEKQLKFWKINYRGNYCIAKRQSDVGSCSAVSPEDNGGYKLSKNGQQTDSLSNFAAGDLL